VLVDPFLDNNPLADVKAAALNPTHILVSHAHGDHSEDVLSIAKRTKAPVVTNYEMANYFQAHGAPKTQGLNFGGGWNLEFGRVTYTVALHTSTFPDGSNGGLPGGWVIEISGKTIYFAGDTALFGDMKLIGELWNIDLACLPIGDCFTMGPAHAMKAAAMLKTKRVLPIHYDTFPPIKQDAAKFAADLKRETGIEGVPLKAGQTLDL
jgi:L-ascorbate metabolism protein UlaG (beta-lactamase superfamily)